MDLRFVAVMMAVAIVMDMLGRMAKKRAAERQGLPGEEMDAAGGPVERPWPFDADEDRGPVPGEAPEPPRRDRAPRPVVVRSPAPRAEKPGWELAEPTAAPPDEAWSEAPVALPAPEPPRRPAPVALAPSDTAPRPAPAVVPAAVVPSSRRTPAARPEGGEDRLGLGTIGGLRKALVAREVLGPPVALRGGPGEDGARERR